MINKHILRPDRLRQIPTSFSWVDHRLVRHEHLRHRGPVAWALYLFLVTVADAEGLSYYSDASIICFKRRCCQLLRSVLHILPGNFCEMPTPTFLAWIGSKAEWASVASAHFGKAVDPGECAALVVTALVAAWREIEDRG
jgi:hypothetical protein